jgi:hypothetical protein
MTWSRSRRPLGTDEDLVTVRFAHGGVVADLGVAWALELDESELGTVDALRWSVVATTPSRTRRSSASWPRRPTFSLRWPPALCAHPVPRATAWRTRRGALPRSLWDAPAIGRAGIDDPALAVLLAHAARHGEVVPTAAGRARRHGSERPRPTGDDAAHC